MLGRLHRVRPRAQARPEPGGVLLLQEAGALEEELSSIHCFPGPEQAEEEARYLYDNTLQLFHL